MAELGLIFQLFSWKIKQLLFRKKSEKNLERAPREDCYLDQCSILGNDIISLSHKLIHIDYNKKCKQEYASFDALLQDNLHYDSIIDKAFTKSIGKYIFKKYPNSLIHLERIDKNKFSYKCNIISVDSFIKIFTDASIRESIEEMFKDSLGIRYTGSTKLYSESLQHYIGTTLRYENKFVEHDKMIQFYSNFNILLKMLNKESSDVFDMYIINEQFIQYVEESLDMTDLECREIFDVVVGDSELESFVCFNEILK